MPIISVNLSDELTQKLDETAGKRNRSRFIAQCIEAYLSPPSHVETGELQDLQNKLNVKEQEIKKSGAEIEKLRSEHSSLKSKYDELLKAIEKLKSDNSELKSKYDELEKVNQENNKSKEAVVIGLQHNLELKDAQIKALEHEIVLQKDTIHELKGDKERLSKRNELFTAHLLSPPKKPLLTRIKERFGRKSDGETAGV